MRWNVRDVVGVVWFVAAVAGVRAADGQTDGQSKGEPSPVTRLADGTVVVSSPTEFVTTVLSVTPAGKHVAKGEPLGELDAAPVRARLDIQLLDVRSAEAHVASARLAREAAELSVEECNATGLQEAQALRDAVAVATRELELAKTLFDESTRRKDREEQLAAARRAVTQAQSALAAAQTRLATFESITLRARRQQATSGLTAARAVEASRQQDLAGAEARAAQLRLQVNDCRIVAPIAGTLHHVRPGPTSGEAQYLAVRAGATVQPGQPLFRIVPDIPAPSTPGSAPAKP